MIAEINEDRDGVRRREDASKHGLDELSLVALCGVGRSDGDVVGQGMILLPLLGIEVTVLVSARGVVLLLLSFGDKGMSFGALVGSTAVRGIRRAFVRGGAAARATAARTRRWARRVRAARMFAACGRKRRRVCRGLKVCLGLLCILFEDAHFLLVSL